MTSLAGYRIVVVGASSGIGREVGIQAGRAGASVAFAARRVELLEEAVGLAGGASFARATDVRDDEQCASLVAEAADRFGGLDAVVYSTGKSPLFHLEDATGDMWREVIETNVVGAAMIARAALSHLKESSGRMLFLGSSSVGRPYPGLVAYTTSKAALHEFARGLRNEYPWLRVTNFVVGPTMSDFANSWDPETAMEMFGRWTTEGYPAGETVTAEDMADQVVRVLASGARVEEVHVMPDQPRPGEPSVPAGAAAALAAATAAAKTPAAGEGTS
jgi:NAD(P)-dependent dehydrogenase (short-subunit alcohol dehydrogenase family)